jgi:2-polyprenyl-3-methyl-5-hydroxy-6-metoxy-1,4-benzoquinol methylase
MASLNYLLLRYLLKLHNYLYLKISGLAVKLNKGTHPKHQIMKFHQFFLDNIERGSKILDIGCGIGALTYSISKKAKEVVACDLNPISIEFAKKNYRRNNIEYIVADATNYDFKQKFDYITLSNVLEHIKDRKQFLQKLKPLTNWFIIRVPMINRSWLTLYKKELGIEYRSDSTHYIEYTFDSFKEEIESVDLNIESYQIQFGEIWARISC